MDDKPSPGDPLAEDGRSTLDAIGEEAQRALRERPSISIRTRLGVVFLLWIILSLGMTALSMLTISQIQSKLSFLEATGNYSFEIQQARRFEKNYFLYQTNLEDALEHVQYAHGILDGERENIVTVVGVQKFQTMSQELDRYQELLGRLRGAARPSQSPDIEAELRVHGAQMVTVARELRDKEREAVDAMLEVSRSAPIAFLVLIILLVIYFSIIVARQVLAPLNRMMEASRRIAEGDLTPITPVKRYRDEFSRLAMAMNHMMLQLVRRHEMLVQAHKLKAVGTLTAGVAHELNNPINNIMLTAETLREDYESLPDEERLDMVNDLVGQSERAQKIVRNLLDFARESEIESEVHEIQDLIEDTLRLATNQIKLAEVKVKGDLAPNLPPIYGDRQQIEQVFLNIVLNALDAMPNGGALSIACNGTSDRDLVSVAFTDTGIGIPEQRVSDVFNPFYTTKPDAKGTGLGLSVSLGIIRQHGGDIKVKSEVGKGTTFSVFLPVAKVPAEIADEEQASEAPLDCDPSAESGPIN
jgi:two-component system NtrC family sensor kinase